MDIDLNSGAALRNQKLPRQCFTDELLASCICIETSFKFLDPSLDLYAANCQFS